MADRGFGSAAKPSNLLNFVLNGAENTDGSSKQVTIGEDILQGMEFDQWNGVDYLYKIEPQSQNLFFAGYFCEAGASNDTSPNPQDQSGSSMKMFYNARYRIRKITIPFPSMEIEYHPELRAPMPKSVNYQNEITIDWFEDVYHSVQKYHIDWFNRWYTREYDCFRCGIQGKFRKLAIVAFHYVNKNIESGVDSIVPVPKIEPLFCFVLGGLIPKQIPSMTFDYNADQNDNMLSMTYHCGPIRWIYTSDLGFGDTNPGGLFSDNATSAMKVANDLPASKNIPFLRASNDTSSQVGEDKNSNWEKLRIIRAATYYQAAEASI
jgi:hypothetical protein